MELVAAPSPTLLTLNNRKEFVISGARPRGCSGASPAADVTLRLTRSRCCGFGLKLILCAAESPMLVRSKPALPLTSVGTDLCQTSAGDTPRGKARRLKSHPTCSAPQYELPSSGVLAIFAFGVNYSSLKPKDDFRVALVELRVWRGRTKIWHILSRIFYQFYKRSTQPS